MSCESSSEPSLQRDQDIYSSDKGDKTEEEISEKAI